MMTTLFFYYSVAMMVVVALLLATTVVLQLRHGEQRWMARLEQRYLNLTLRALFAAPDAPPPHFPMLRCLGARWILARTLARLTCSTYGLDREPLRAILRATDLEGYLLRHARLLPGACRAYCLCLLARLPVQAQTLTQVAVYAADRDPGVRFYALLAQLAQEAKKPLHRMAIYPASLSRFEIAEILAMLQRAMLPIAYKPLLSSPNRNLRMLGLGVVRQFGIQTAERALLRMVALDAEVALRSEALYTLCALRCSLARREVAVQIEQMSLSERRALLRYLAAEGYAPRAVNRLFRGAEIPYFASLVDTHKRCLICS